MTLSPSISTTKVAESYVDKVQNVKEKLAKGDKIGAKQDLIWLETSLETILTIGDTFDFVEPDKS